MTTKDHAKLLGIFHLINAGLQLFSGILLAVVYGGLGTMFIANAKRDDEQVMGGFFLLMAVIAVILCIVFSALYAYSGWNLFKHKPHSKVWAIIASAVSILGFPLGTALGIYGFWFTLGDNGKEYYDGEATMTSYTPPPPPNSWQ